GMTWSWRGLMGSLIGRWMSVVGTLWSSVATVRSGRRTERPARRRPSKAWGLVTSWTRWRSTYRRSGSPGPAWTTWRSHTFWARVVGIVRVSLSETLFSSRELHRNHDGCAGQGHRRPRRPRVGRAAPAARPARPPPRTR